MPPTLFCLGSAVAFGATGVLGKLAYGQGATVGTLLAARFLVVAALFWPILVATGRVRAVRMIARRDLAIAVALGSVGYSVQAGLAFGALARLDASLFSLLIYTFPVFVTLAAMQLPAWWQRSDVRLTTRALLTSNEPFPEIGAATATTTRERRSR